MRLEAHRVFAHQRLHPLEPYFRFLVSAMGRRIISAGHWCITSGNYGSNEQKFGVM
jgi:hypothetical protein